MVLNLLQKEGKWKNLKDIVCQNRSLLTSMTTRDKHTQSVCVYSLSQIFGREVVSEKERKSR